LEAYRNTFANLALPLFAMAEPLPPKKFKHESLEWSIWDRWILEGDLTVQEVLDWFKVFALSPYSGTELAVSQYCIKADLQFNVPLAPSTS
jgi:ubiquitin-activating enzyme E1